ncbi:substrate-binding domain-containing protein [Methylophaga thiooxydans]|uniref:substrate-binding domain-containing protein n=1 Tax=Methylophaga thiooxydans TaxID=392484 RepID=UPI00235726A2|nr:substrate-binding domain-containing protein [Methylophaga thiooxydans]
MKWQKGLSLILLLVTSSMAMAVEHLKLSTTTSTDNSGLLAVLNPAFEAKFDAKVDVIAVGTGKALKIGSNGDVDVVFVHAPAAELKYVESGDFIDRSAVMHNDFVVVGPEADPANIAKAENAAGAFMRIADAKTDFISRGDDSGTHKKEKALWDNAGLTPTGKWYVAAGQGMGAVLKIADEKQAYALADRGTQIAYAEKMNLKVLFEGDEVLFNPYHVMAVNPAKHGHAKYDLAKKYIDFVTGEEGQTIIKDFRLNGQQLFHPDAIE